MTENLYRLEPSGGYYGLVKRGDKQFRRWPRTKVRKLAERRLKEFCAQGGNLTSNDDAFLSFADAARRWMAVTSHTLKPSSALRREQCIRYSGCRLSEATSMRWSDVDFEKNAVTVTEARTAPRITSSAPCR